MKTIVLLLTSFLFFFGTLFAQSNTIVHYMDSGWAATSPELAVRKVVKEFDGKIYHSKAYDLKENYYIGYGYYLDTTYNKPVGTHVEYFKDGKTKDSSYY